MAVRDDRVGVVEVVDTTLGTVSATISVGASGDIAITPDGARAYVAAGLVYVIDTATNAVVSPFPAETATIPNVTNNATTVAISPDGTRAYVGMYTFNMTGGGFGAGGSVVLVDTASETVTGAINLGSLPGPIALTPDGSRLYVGHPVHVRQHRLWLGVLAGTAHRRDRHDHRTPSRRSSFSETPGTRHPRSP